MSMFVASVFPRVEVRQEAWLGVLFFFGVGALVLEFAL